MVAQSRSDLAAAEACTSAGRALDAACFHCQQAAEKALKAWLIARGEEFPLIHDLTKLLMLCSQFEPEFNRFLADAAELNPFAVEMRYDAEFWPSAQDAREAIRRAHAVCDFVRKRWPHP